MSTIRPLPGIRYRTTPEDRDISKLLAPPYDILDQADKERLLAQDERNFVKIDLPFIPPKSAGPPEVYQQAAEQMKQWLADGTLVQDQQPSIYVYHQAYRYDGADYVRKMFFARLKIEPFGTGSVFPHERTFGGPKEDRLALTKATKANLSPIFGLYQDEQNVVAGLLEQAIGDEPLAVGTLEQVENRLWAVSDDGLIGRVQELLADKATYIADGHHRYGTAGMYRDWLIEQQGQLPPEHPANFVLCVFCAMEDPGLLILPTHRVLPGIKLTAETLKHHPAVEVAHLLVDDAEQVPAALAKFGPQAVGLWNAADQSYYMVRPNDPGLLDQYEPEHCEAWRRLGLTFLHAYLIERFITPELAGGQAPEIRYVKSASAAVQQARESDGSVFLMQATTMEELRAVCQAGEVMPQKSTYFYPKLASGLVINPLE